MYKLQTHFGFTNLWSKVASFWAWSSQKVKKGTRTPCICLFLTILSTSIYDLVLIYVCHFHHHHPALTFPQIWLISRYSCCYLGSLHPWNFAIRICCYHFICQNTFQHERNLPVWTFSRKRDTHSHCGNFAKTLSRRQFSVKPFSKFPSMKMVIFWYLGCL